MADWSAEDEREYQALLRERDRLRAQEEGERRLQQARAAVPKPATEPKNAFSTIRAVLGGLRDTAQGIWSYADSADAWLENKTGIGGMPMIEHENGKLSIKWANSKEFDRSIVGKAADIPHELPDFEGSKNAGTTEKIARNLVGFLVPFAGVSKVLKTAEAVSVVGRSARVLTASAAATAVTVDPVENNLANTVKGLTGWDNKLLNSLTSTKDDDKFEARLKGVVANLPVDLAMEGITEGVIPLVKAYRQARFIKEDSKGLIDAVQEDLRVKRSVASVEAKRLTESGVRVNGVDPLAPSGKPVPKPSNDNLVSPESLLSPAKEKPKAPVEAVTPAATHTGEAGGAALAPAEAAPVPKAETIKPQQITTLDEFVDYAKKVVGQISDPERLDKIGKALVENPHNALDELGIDPLKLDLSTFSDPEKIMAMQHSLAGLVDDVAAKTGRTGLVVSNAETVRAGRALAMTPRTLKALMERTGNLASHMTGARLLVGQHAHKLVADVDAAIGELMKGGAGKAYNEFLETLSRHAVLLGTLRGAGSEIARALQSLKMAATVKEAGKVITDQAEQALAKARGLADKAAERVAKGQAKEDAKAAARSAKEVDHTSPEVLKFLEQMTEGRVDDAALSAIAAKHGIEPKDVAKQLGLDWSQVAKLREAEAKYTELFKDLATDAGKLRLLNQLKGAEGDLEKLSQVARSRQMTFLQKADAMVRETSGNLFSIGTATANTVSAVTVLGLKTMSHGLAMLAYAPLGMASERFALAARIHMMKAWASIHAPVMAFSDATSSTWALLKESGFDEAAAILDSAGWEAQAKQLQAKAIEAGHGVRGDFTRSEAVTLGGDGVLDEVAGAMGNAIDRARGKTGYEAHAPGQREIYVNPETLHAINQMAEEWPLGRWGQEGLKWTSRTVATAVNVAGGATRLARTALINAPDQFAGVISARVGAHSAAVDQAVKEAAEAELTGKALYDYIKNRSIQLADGIDGISAEPFEDGMREVLLGEGTNFAKRTLFQDDLEFSFSRVSGSLVSSIPVLGPLLAPFVKTPLRILEVTALDYTPLGLLKKDVRNVLLHGDEAARGEIAARMTLGMGSILAAYYLADDRTIVGYDGGSASSARLARGSYSLRIGGDVVEFGRLDPLGTLLGFGADVRAALKESEDGDASVLYSVWEAAMWGVFKNVLSKTWMQSFQQLNDLAAARSPDDFSTKLSRFVAAQATRVVPASGLQRQFDKSAEGVVREASGFTEGVLKSSWGASTLPVKRDGILGRPVEMTFGERTHGMKAGPQSSEKLIREMDALSFDAPLPARKLKGVRLDSTQFSRMLELRGQIVRDKTGMTLEEKLQAIVHDPDWDKLGRNQKVEVLRQSMNGYQKLASDQLIREDSKLAYAVLRAETWDQFRSHDKTRDESDAATRKMAMELGIPIRD